MDYIETWKEVIQKPADFYRKMPTTGGYAEPLTFAAISYFIYGLLSVLFNRETIGDMYGYGMGTGGYGLSNALIFAIMFPIMGIISILIGAAILYIIYKVLGGKGSYEGTVRFICYATAVMLLSWIPFIGWVFGFYGLYLYILGGMIVHDVSMVKSAVAVLLPLVLVILLAVAAAVLILSSTFSTLV
jgi:hypothetical protein